MTKYKLKILLSRINSKLENIAGGTVENKRLVEEIVEKIADPSFSAGVARGIIQRLENNGSTVPMGLFEGLIRDLLLFMDRLESLEKADPKMTSLRLELDGALERAGLEPISINEPFNPIFHRVEYVIEGPSESPSIVLQLRPGYKIQGKVIRPAGVAVQMKRKTTGGHNEQEK